MHTHNIKRKMEIGDADTFAFFVFAFEAILMFFTSEDFHSVDSFLKCFCDKLS